MLHAIQNPQRLLTAAALAALLPAVAQPSAAQTHETVFVHGLGELGSYFDPLASDLASRYPIIRLQPNSLGSGSLYGTQASTLRAYLQIYAATSTVAAIGHSNGGVVVREYARQSGTHQVNRHLSVGSPHLGARLAASVESGELAFWASTVSWWPVFNVIPFYAQNDPDWWDLWFNDEPAPVIEGAADLLLDGIVISLGAAAVALDCQIGGVPSLDCPPVISQMWPGSAFLTTLNSSASLNQEAQRLSVARVGLSTKYPPELMPWRAVVCDPDPFQPVSFCNAAAQDWYWLMQEVAWFAWDAYWYYLFHPNWILRDNAWRWEDLMYALLGIPSEWQGIIGAAWYGQSDGIVPWVSSDYPQGTRDVHVTQVSVYHVDQLAPVADPETDSYWGAVRDVVENNFNIQAQSGGGGDPLDVTIGGPLVIRPGATCTWTASVSDGQPPYGYSWTGQIQPYGTGGQYYTGGKDPIVPGNEFTLRVDVTDAGTGSGWAQITVTEDPGAPVCFQ